MLRGKIAGVECSPKIQRAQFLSFLDWKPETTSQGCSIQNCIGRACPQVFPIIWGRRRGKIVPKSDNFWGKTRIWKLQHTCTYFLRGPKILPPKSCILGDSRRVSIRSFRKSKENTSIAFLRIFSKFSQSILKRRLQHWFSMHRTWNLAPIPDYWEARSLQVRQHWAGACSPLSPNRAFL